MKVLLLCFDNPFLPPNEGGKKSMLTRIRSLCDLGVELDVVLLNKRSEGFSSEYGGLEERVHTVKQYQMRFSYGMLLSRYPICVSKRYVRECVDFLADKEYDLAIYEGAHMMKYRIKGAVNAKKHWLYMHDIESAYRRELSRTQKGFAKRLLQRMEARRFRHLEKKIDALFDRVMFVSDEEREALAAHSTHPEDYIYLPVPSTSFAPAPRTGKRGKILLYVGDLSLEHNVLSLFWFLQEVFLRVQERDREASVRVIGRISEENRQLLAEVSERIEVLGYVDDLQAELEGAAAIVCPVLYGAGVKVKTIDAIAQGQLVIGTAKAVEGTKLEGGTHLIVSDEADALIGACLEILKDRGQYDAMIRQGFAFVTSHHSVENQTAILADMIKES